MFVLLFPISLEKREFLGAFLHRLEAPFFHLPSVHWANFALIFLWSLCTVASYNLLTTKSESKVLKIR